MTNRTPHFFAGLACVAIMTVVWAALGQSTGKPAADANALAPPAQDASFMVVGVTQCIHTRKAIIAPTVLHPVIEVFVAPGDKVKKGQKLVQLDKDEPEADLRAKEANLESARITRAEAKRLLSSVEAIQSRGVMPEQRIFEIRTAALKAEKDEKAAEAVRDAAREELSHFTIEAAIDGVVNRIDCHPGMVSRPGTTVWGEILDLSEIDVVCPLNQRQVDRVKVNQTVEVLHSESGKALATGKVVFIGLEFNPKTATVPAHVRVANPDGVFRCGAPATARFAAK